MINSKFKMGLIGVAVSCCLSGSVFASEIVFDNSGNYSDIQTFTGIDLSVDTATVIQTDNGDGVLSVGDTFNELGGTDVVTFLPQLFPTSFPAHFGYELIYDYSIDGVVSNVDFLSHSLDLAFTSGNASMIMRDINPLDGITADITLFSGTLLSGGCGLNVDVDLGTNDIVSQQNAGSCGVAFLMDVIEPGLLTFLGDDISTFTGLKTPVFSAILTVQNVTGLNFVYAAPGATQTFTVVHDGNAEITIPEPTSLALLGLGLLGFGAAARKRKS